MDIVDYIAGYIVFVRFIFPAFAVDVRPDALDCFHRGRKGNDNHMTNALECGQAMRTQLVVEIGASRSLVYVRLTGNRHGKDIPKRPSLLQVKDVSGMDEIKRAVALNDPFPLFA